MIPLLQCLLFGLGHRFPQEAILLALDALFNPEHWPATQDEFYNAGLFDGPIAVLSTHYSQVCTIGGKSSAIEPAKLTLEHQAAKVYLRDCFQDAQAELYDQAAKDLATKKYHTASTAAPVQSANFHSKFTNPYLSAHDSLTHGATGHELPKPAPIVSVSMLSILSHFIANVRAQQNCPNWVLLARIALTICVSTGSCERAFSVMKQIVTRLRSRLSQPMLDALMRIKLCDGASMTDDHIMAAVDLWFKIKFRRGGVDAQAAH